VRAAAIRYFTNHKSRFCRDRAPTGDVVDIAAAKPALYAAALCTILPLLMGAKDTTAMGAMSTDPEPMLARYTSESRDLSNDATSAADRIFSTEPMNLPPAPLPQRNLFAPCDLIATLPTGEAYCYLIRW
jgi:hypothetical protein